MEVGTVYGCGIRSRVEGHRNWMETGYDTEDPEAGSEELCSYNQHLFVNC